MLTNKWLLRIMELTDLKKIKWVEKPSLFSKQKRIFGTGLHHKFIIRICEDSEKNYICWIKKYCTDLDLDNWMFAKSEQKEINYFIEKMLDEYLDIYFSTEEGFSISFLRNLLKTERKKKE